VIWCCTVRRVIVGDVEKCAVLYICRKRLPNQAAAVSISYLGIGSISMTQLQTLPPATVLRRWLKHTSRAIEAAAKHPGQVRRHGVGVGEHN
jgi:hypothetical protein